MKNENTKRIKFQTLEELTSCLFCDSFTEQQKEEKRKNEKLIKIFRKCVVFNLMKEEIENAKQSTEKMKLQCECESSGSICIDTSKMEYVENESNCE